LTGMMIEDAGRYRVFCRYQRRVKQKDVNCGNMAGGGLCPTRKWQLQLALDGRAIMLVFCGPDRSHAWHIDLSLTYDSVDFGVIRSHRCDRLPFALKDRSGIILSGYAPNDSSQLAVMGVVRCRTTGQRSVKCRKIRDTTSSR